MSHAVATAVYASCPEREKLSMRRRVIVQQTEKVLGSNCGCEPAVGSDKMKVKKEKNDMELVMTLWVNMIKQHAATSNYIK